MPQHTILEGSTFCICDELGDVREPTHGLFADDTRFLSQLELTIDGKRPLLRSSGGVAYFSARGSSNGKGIGYDLTLAPRETWKMGIDIGIGTDGAPGRAPHVVERHFGEERARVAESVSAWELRVPQIRATWNELRQTFGQSVNDLAALRMRTADDAGHGKLPAAGMPWFMTVFGRDTLITCLQTLMFGPELARSALRELAALQATEVDPSRDAEPGKIVHEVRRGKCAVKWFDRYYGSVDATPLFPVLLSETWRWTDDTDLVQELRRPALPALRWIDEDGDPDGGGVVEDARPPERGLDNPSGKDPRAPPPFHDGPC